VSTGRADLVLVAKRLGRLREHAAFVGGATLELLISDVAAPPVRPTDDVDVVLPVRSRREFLEDVTAELRRAGFKHDLRDDAPICRWIVEGVTVDVMPADATILGFANRWYDAGLRHAQHVDLEPGLAVRVFTAPYFLATKLEAFKDRGRGDFLGSADLEDIVAVVDGRAELLSEVASASSELRSYLAAEFQGLLANGDFLESLEGHLPADRASQARLPKLRSKFEQLANLRSE
jgi:predicted nucleotidyltransferase